MLPAPGSEPHAYYHADGNGNITALIATNQTLVAQYHYDPYGNILGIAGPLAEANLYRFSSKELHPNSGLVYYLYRYYEPSLQRWINRDPIGQNGGLNPYSFLQNDSVNSTDPHGLWVISWRLNLTATFIVGVNFSIGITLDDDLDIGVQISGKPDKPGLNRCNAVGIGVPPGPSISLTGGWTVTNADCTKEQYGETKSLGVFGGAYGGFAEVNGVWGKGKTDSGGDTYWGIDWGAGIGTSGGGIQGSIVSTQPICK